MKNYRVWWVFCGVVSVWYLLSACAVKSFQYEGQKYRSATELARLLFDNSDVHTGILVVDADRSDASALVDFNSYALFTPASNTKILTLSAALKFLPDRLHGLSYIRQGDTTYFKGTGDPGFLDPRFPAQEVVSFLHDQSDLIFVTDWVSDQRWGSGWSWDDYPYYYSPQLSPLPIYGNMATAWCEGGEWNVWPAAFILNKTNSAAYYRVKRQEYANVLQLNAARCTEHPIRVPFVWNPRVAVDLLGEKLGREVHSTRIFPAETTTSWQHVPGSYRDTLLRTMMYDSDNFIAEQLMLNISDRLWGKLEAGKSIDSMMQTDFALWKDKIRWVDGSGLSIYNKFSPRFIVDVLGQLYGTFPRDRLFSFFPAGGVRGTIQSWYGHPSQPYVFAKTGTLSSVHALSGYLIADSGRTFIFSMMHNNYLGSSNAYKEKMQIFLEFLKQNY